MIVFRQVDGRYPFLWEDAAQPPGRWHGDGEGPAHYCADTPDGAWAEFLRHEEITEAADLVTIRRQMWAIEIGDEPPEVIALPHDVLTGGRESYARCQREARIRRARGVRRIAAVSAALIANGARGLRVRGGVQAGTPRDGLTIVLFGTADDLAGWIAAEDGHPAADLLERVRHFAGR
jgi:RES domain-containing protein